MPALTRRGLLAAPAALLATPALANWPVRPIRLVVPFTPGGGTDSLARLVARPLTERLGQSVVVENRGGAGGNIGATLVAQSPPDGYTMLMNGNGIAITDKLFRNPGFDWRRDFTHVARFASSLLVLAVNPALPVRTLPEFIAYARANPGRLNHGTPGAGTAPHLAGGLFDDMAGTRIAHVPYRGTGLAVAALVSGEIQVMYAAATSVEQLVQEGRLRALAVLSAKRARGWPDLPTVGEVVPGYAAELWYTTAVPAATPPDVVATIERAARDSMADPAFQRLLSERGFEPDFLDSRALTAALEAEAAMWGAVLGRIGITPE
jgi:tripartite-type tricarboxylate transporter receptor subunit TctC